MVINQDQDAGSQKPSFVFGHWLKIDKEEEEGGMDFNGDHMTRVCRICGKEFSSGKALGGHMRIHDLKKQKSRDRPIVQNPHDVYLCSVCGKEFPSMKSVSGHMRSHPDRDWRGIVPPLPDGGDTDSVDLMQLLKTWPIKAKRGRKLIKYQDDLAEKLHLVEQLMMLSKGELKKKKKIRKKKMKLCDLSSDKFKCHICDKSFPTHQALGGHCSSHNKLTINAGEDDHKTSNNESEVVEAPSSEGTSYTGQKVFVIDLNEVPPSEDGSQPACFW